QILRALNTLQQFIQKFLGDRHACFLSVKHGPDQSYTEDRTLSHPKKRCARRGQNARTDPLVDPGNPAHREPHGPASDPGNSDHRLVNLEKNPSSRRKARTYASKIATVMLATAAGG
ncbi:hypothetical protein, partial [Paracoccus sp. PAR01]|uniref:hypothetical protein n=1 Tax=Paracoccus sp. PAR01 TaxID=2769282 RepID=UPI001CE0F6CE